MRLPNNYGSVYKLSGNRRKPWTARIKVGDNIDYERMKAWAKYKYLGFYATKAEALEALAIYNGQPYDVDRRQMTLQQVYDEWKPQHSQKIKKFSNYDTAWKILSPLGNRRMPDIKLRDVQNAFDVSGKNSPQLDTAKTLVCLLWDYAAINETVTKERRDLMSYLDTSKPGNPNKRERTIFTSEEVKYLWEHKDDQIAVMALILIYTGMRISELVDAADQDVDAEKQFINVRDAKTAAGIRIVPIADKIVPLIPVWLKTRHRSSNSSTHYYLNYLWPKGMKRLGLEHYSHDCRHTCTTLLTELHVSSEIRHAILGHSKGDVEERVYTHIQLPTMLEAVNMLP